jgi:release factor glutamine methyltransferase
MLLKDMIFHGRGLLSAVYSETEAREMVSSYFEDKFSLARHHHLLYPDYMLSEPQVRQVMTDMDRMAAGEPLQYVTGEAYFYGRTFSVTADTLIPRPETELLCRLAVEAAAKPNPRVLDLCTGSGCIAWTLALELPKAEVTAVDISDGALSVASSQDFSGEMARTGASAPTFTKADILAGPASHKTQQYDIILSNPPYVMDKEKPLMRSNVLDYEPHLALFVPDADPLIFYRAVADWAAELLAPDGFGVVEINEALGEETAEVFRTRGFAKAEVVKDLYEKDRFVRFSWK